MKRLLNYSRKDRPRGYILIVLFASLIGMGVSALKPEMRSASYWIQIHAPIWIAVTDTAIVGFCLILIAHALRTKSPKSISAILALAYTTFTPTFVVMYGDTPKLGMILEIFLVACVLYAAMMVSLVVSGEEGFLREVKDIPMQGEETWTDEFEHLKVKEELEYELSQEFPDFWSASSHFTKRKKLELLERAAAKFHEKYGRREMALIVKELKERIESA